MIIYRQWKKQKWRQRFSALRASTQSSPLLQGRFFFVLNCVLWCNSWLVQLVLTPTQLIFCGSIWTNLAKQPRNKCLFSDVLMSDGQIDTSGHKIRPLPDVLQPQFQVIREGTPTNIAAQIGQIVWNDLVQITFWLVPSADSLVQ